MREQAYRRAEAVEYARICALKRNPRYLDFEKMGGDCTNFASQCLFAGSGVMNPTKVLGWYYYNAGNRTASWTGVEYLYRFLVANKGVGPFAVETDESHALPGDIVQFGNAGGHFYHSPVIVEVSGGKIYVAAHTFDAYRKPLDEYVYNKARFLHISGVRNW